MINSHRLYKEQLNMYTVHCTVCTDCVQGAIHCIQFIENVLHGP